MFNLLNIFRRLATGVVTGKNHYGATGVNRQNLTSFNKGVAEVAVIVNTPATTEGWSLVVSGTDKSGRHLLTKEIYADQETWSNTPIGSKWSRSKP